LPDSKHKQESNSYPLDSPIATIFLERWHLAPIYG